MNRVITKIFLIAALLLNSCHQSLVLESKIKNIDYDIIRSFLITDDGNIVFIGNNFQYIFNDNRSEISKLLKWKYRDHFIISDYTRLTLNEYAELNGVVKVGVIFKTTKEIIEDKDLINFLKKENFQPNQKNNDISFFEKEIKLNGSMRKSKPYFDTKKAIPLFGEYRIYVVDQFGEVKNGSTKTELVPSENPGAIVLGYTVYGVAMVAALSIVTLCVGVGVVAGGRCSPWTSSKNKSTVSR